VIVDYSTARPSMAQLKAAGVTAVGRYLGWDSVPGFSSIGKNLTAAEVTALHAAGIAVFAAFEYDPQAPAKGEPQGARDGTLADRQLAELGAPPQTGVYFACDWDIADYAPKLPDLKASAKAKLGPIADYFTVINEQHPGYRVGAYGGFYAVKRLFDAGLISLGWQTVAWSGGQRDTRAQLYQTTGKVPVGGADLDIHEGTVADFGQWAPGPPAAGDPPSQPPAANWTEILMNELPTLAQGATGEDVRTLQGALVARHYTVAVDGAFGAATKTALEAFQRSVGLTADAVCGKLTWPKLMNR
jgi:Domain of unknown function (DUF1906)/Putative peptidoglycan binding domain